MKGYAMPKDLKSLVYKIESGVSIPPKVMGNRADHNSDRRKLANTLEIMEVGQSFLVPDELDTMAVRSYISVFGKHNRKRFSVKHDTKGHLRCWRTS